MPGQTNNPNLLAAENQEIVALNEVVTAIENIDIPPAQVEITLNTTGLETAITTLQTALVSTLDALRVAMKTLNFCCSLPSAGPPEPGEPGGGTPGDPPGEGQTDPPGTAEEKEARRCKVAMWLINDYLETVVTYCDQYNVDLIINTAAASGFGLAVPITAGIAAAAIAGVVGLFVTPGPDPLDAAVAMVALALVGAVTYLIVNGGLLEFADLAGFIDNNREKMICALANSQNSWSAHSALMSVIDNASPGLNPGNRQFVKGMMGSDPALGLLFYVDDRYPTFEDWIAEQTEPCPCEDTTPEEGTPTDLYKCKAANYLFDGFIDSLTGWGTVANMTWYTTPSFISALTGGLLWTLLGGIYNLVFVGITAVAAFIAKIVSFLGVLFWNGFDYFTAFEEIAALFEAQKAAIICELYLAADVDTVRTELENRIDDYVGTVMTAHPEWADQEDTYKDVLKALLPNTVLNVLFEETERPEITAYEPEDFQECVCGFTGDCWTGEEFSAFGVYTNDGVSLNVSPSGLGLSGTGDGDGTVIQLRQVAPSTRFRLSYNLEVFNGPVTCSMRVWFSDGWVEDYHLSATYTPGIYEFTSDLTLENKEATHFGIFCGVGMFYSGTYFNVLITEICLSTT